MRVSTGRFGIELLLIIIATRLSVLIREFQGVVEFNGELIKDEVGTLVLNQSLLMITNRFLNSSLLAELYSII
jgi:hypothetical protein